MGEIKLKSLEMKDLKSLIYGNERIERMKECLWKFICTSFYNMNSVLKYYKSTIYNFKNITSL